MFPDDLCADFFTAGSRRSVPAMIVVMVMVRIEGLSDRAARSGSRFAARWTSAAGAAITNREMRA